MRFYKFIVFIATLFLSSCAPENAPQARFETLGLAYCECTTHLVELNLKLAKPDGEKPSFKELEAEYLKSKDCLAAVIGKYGRIKPADISGVELVLSQKCPTLTSMPEWRQTFRELMGE